MEIESPNSLKRCLSAPIINNLPGVAVPDTPNQAQPIEQYQLNQRIQKKVLISLNDSSKMIPNSTIANIASTGSSPHRPNSHDLVHFSPAINIFAPKARRYSASFSPLPLGVVGSGSGPRLTPRVSQLRQEECVDLNSREINHEREVHSAMQVSQSCEDLRLCTENWSCKSDDMNPLQVSLPTMNGFGTHSCSSPSPTSRATMRLPYGLSPSPTRRTFATRRSMSPIAMRPSQLGPVKRKFELDDGSNCYSPPPLKKIFTESRGPSPICQSPDSGTYDGRVTPKLLSKLCTSSTTATNSVSSMCSSPGSVLDSGSDIQSNVSSNSANTMSSLYNFDGMNTVSFNSETLDCVSSSSGSKNKEKSNLNFAESQSTRIGHHLLKSTALSDILKPNSLSSFSEHGDNEMVSDSIVTSYASSPGVDVNSFKNLYEMCGDHVGSRGQSNPMSDGNCVLDSTVETLL